MKKKALFVALLAVGMGFAGLAFAVVDDGNEDAKMTKEERKAQLQEKIQERKEKMEERKEQIQEKKGEIQEKKEERKEKHCENIEKRVQTRVQRYENNHNRHEKILSNMEGRLDRVITIFEDKGLDVSDLEADAATLSGMIDDLIATHGTFIDELKESENYACGESDGEFKNQLGEARKVLPEVKEGIEEIRDFYKNTIRPEILELKEQLEGGEDDNNDDE